MAFAKDSLLLYGRQPGVVKSGVMYYKPARIGLQTSVWPVGNVKKYWCELHRESSYHPRELVLVEMSKNISKDVETIPLETVFKITRREGLIKEKSIFQIMTSNGKFTLGTDSLEKTEKWIRVLNEEIFGPPKHNVIYEYRVKVQKTYNGDISCGSYLLKVYDDEIKIFTPNGLIPTKFTYSIKDICKVRYHAFGQLKSCVTISIKNAETNNKEIDVVILNANSASEVERVINYRKKILFSQDKLDGEIATDEQDPCVPINLLQECLDEIKQNLKGIDITSRSNEAVDTLANPRLRKQKKAHQDACDEKEVFSSDDVDYSDTRFSLLESTKEEPTILSQSSRSLPRIYRVTTNPSVDDHDGEVWSESFELRAPKRKKGIRMKKNSPIAPHRTSSDGPPATLPGDMETSFEDSQSNMEYDHVKSKKLNKIPRLKDANVVLTRAMESHSDDYDGDDVINSTNHNQTYLHVLTPEEESTFAINPDDVRDGFK